MKKEGKQKIGNRDTMRGSSEEERRDNERGRERREVIKRGSR